MKNPIKKASVSATTMGTAKIISELIMALRIPERNEVGSIVAAAIAVVGIAPMLDAAMGDMNARGDEEDLGQLLLARNAMDRPWGATNPVTVSTLNDTASRTTRSSKPREVRVGFIEVIGGSSVEDDGGMQSAVMSVQVCSSKLQVSGR